jgi:hypothetical protein
MQARWGKFCVVSAGGRAGGESRRGIERAISLAAVLFLSILTWYKFCSAVLVLQVENAKCRKAEGKVWGCACPLAHLRYGTEDVS